MQGRPKHIYSVVKKMRGKSLNFDQVLDIRALRVVVPSVKDCYATLSWVHEQFTPIEAEFDDYIAKPKPKRQGVKYTTDINAGLRDIATPASAFIRDPSKQMMTSFSGFGNMPNAGADSSRGGRGRRRGR